MLDDNLKIEVFSGQLAMSELCARYLEKYFEGFQNVLCNNFQSRNVFVDISVLLEFIHRKSPKRFKISVNLDYCCLVTLNLKRAGCMA